MFWLVLSQKRTSDTPSKGGLESHRDGSERDEQKNKTLLQIDSQLSSLLSHVND